MRERERREIEREQKTKGLARTRSRQGFGFLGREGFDSPKAVIQIAPPRSLLLLSLGHPRVTL